MYRGQSGWLSTSNDSRSHLSKRRSCSAVFGATGAAAATAPVDAVAEAAGAAASGGGPAPKRPRRPRSLGPGQCVHSKNCLFSDDDLTPSRRCGGRVRCPRKLHADCAPATPALKSTLITYDRDESEAPLSIVDAFAAEAPRGTYCVECIVFAVRRLDGVALAGGAAEWPTSPPGAQQPPQSAPWAQQPGPPMQPPGAPVPPAPATSPPGQQGNPGQPPTPTAPPSTSRPATPSPWAPPEMPHQ